MKKALSITSKIAIGILAILGVYALVIFVMLKAYLVLRKFDGKNFSFECDEPNRSKP
ncbi:hypothetical protein [Helicobacter pylori]|uniref:hypothetical protein n=1 Tax=Helicobacter pylori TaxID=210 RepID=UPI00165A333F|nr:hypothetical protein [Helicobacter pylori]